MLESQADLLVYGMGTALKRDYTFVKKECLLHLFAISQTAFIIKSGERLPKNKQWDDFQLASHEVCLKNKKAFARNFKFIEQESNKQFGRRLLQEIGSDTLVVNPPYQTMTESEIDASFDLPYTRQPHPKYSKRGKIPAFEMIKFSVNMHRGCFEVVVFTISAHQGKMIASRSKESIMREIDLVTRMPDFKGNISDLGGPSGNMYKMKGKVQSICDRCVSPSCIHPTICHNLDMNHGPLLDIYRSASAHPKVKKAVVSSGIRYDMLVRGDDKQNSENHCDEYIEELVKNHVSGRLKIAPEHTSDKVLEINEKTFFHFLMLSKRNLTHLIFRLVSNNN